MSARSGRPDEREQAATQAAKHVEVPALHPAIAESLSYGQTSDSTETQPAWHAVIHIVVPGVTEEGEPLNQAEASDWISETLRDQFLDWGYVEDGEHHFSPREITVSKPYIEGTFLGPDDGEPIEPHNPKPSRWK